MRIRVAGPVALALWGVSMLGGCRKQAPAASETSATAPAQTGGEADGAVALRREPSELFDKARAAFAKMDTAAAAKALRDAATLVKAEADSAKSGARVGLAAAASNLEAVAANIDKNAIKAN